MGFSLFSFVHSFVCFRDIYICDGLNWPQFDMSRALDCFGLHCGNLTDIWRQASAESALCEVKAWQQCDSSIVV
jgi:hypothetical protein